MTQNSNTQPEANKTQAHTVDGASTSKDVIVDTPDPAQQNLNSDDDAGWKVVTKKSREKENRASTSPISNPYALLAMEKHTIEEVVEGETSKEGDKGHSPSNDT